MSGSPSCAAGSGRGYSPCHITGFFTIQMTGDPMRSGSTGAGICLQDGVTSFVTAHGGAGRVSYASNGECMPIPPTCVSLINAMVSGLGPLRLTVRQFSALPANVGYGLSGASALSLGIALNQALGLGLTAERVAQIAHAAEVENLTGLGDVSAELAGGFELRIRPGAPGIGEVVPLRFPQGHVVVSSPVFPFPTKAMITQPEYVGRINALGATAMEDFLPLPTIENFMRQARAFWEGVGMVKGEMLEVVHLYEDAGIDTPAAKKGLVFGVVMKDALPGTLRRLSPTYKAPAGDMPHEIKDERRGLRFIVSEISKGGAC